MNRALSMSFLTPTETLFLDVYLHDAITSPFFSGPATKALSSLGIEYRDISYLAWACEQDVPRTSFEWGHAAEVAPPLPWPNREAVLRRDRDMQLVWTRRGQLAGATKGS
jgi:hypothetical protein